MSCRFSPRRSLRHTLRDLAQCAAFCAASCTAFCTAALTVSAQRAAPNELDSARHSADSLRDKSPSIAAALAFAPGVGHLYARDLNRGWLLLTTYAAGVLLVQGGRTDGWGKTGGVLVVGTLLTSVIDAPRAARAHNYRVRRVRATQGAPLPPSPPPLLLGRFVDDYGNTFAISPTRFDQEPRGRFHIVEWNPREQFLIARNDSSNVSDAGRWTRIDWLLLPDMAPYTWGFCLTTYRSATREEARATEPPDRRAPRTGCNGYPFSRMRRAE